MEGLARLVFRHDLNRTYLKRPREQAFMDAQRNLTPLQKTLRVVLSRIIPEVEGEDINLDVFLSTARPMDNILEPPYEDLYAVFFPRHDSVRDYVLNPEEEFYSNVHCNPDPLVVRAIRTGIHLHPKRTEERLWLPGRGDLIPNRIEAAILFKENPFKHEYPGFQELMDYGLKTRSN